MKYIILMLILIGSVSAINITDACESKGYANTISAWEYNGTYIETYGSGVEVVGNARRINWTSEIYIDGVVYKSGSRTYLSDGGYNGTIPKTTLSNDIVFVTFCSNNTVPEYGIITLSITLLAGIGIIIYKRK